MKRTGTALTVTALFSLVQEAVTQTPQTNPELYTIQTALSDEFTTNSLNLSKWYDFPADYTLNDVGSCGGLNVFTYFTWTDNGNNYWCNLTGNPSAGNNIAFNTTAPTSVNLICRKEVTAQNVRTSNWGPDLFDCNPRTNTGKSISTKQLFYHGYFEVRAKIPTGGYQTGQQFWLYHAYDNTHPRPAWTTLSYSEIDVFEIDDVYPDICPAALHWWRTEQYFMGEYKYNDHGPKTHLNYSLADGNWHTFGMDWQTNSVDFYIDNVLVQHHVDMESWPNADGDSNEQEEIDPFTNQLFPQFRSVNELQPMRVYLMTKFGRPCVGALPPAGQNENFEIDYFRYYKRKPRITQWAFSGNTLTLTAKEGIDNETYTWTETGPATLGSESHNATSSQQTISMNAGTSTVKVQAKTGAAYADPLYNPELTTFTECRVRSASCWDFCLSDLATGIDEYMAPCINVPGPPNCTSFLVPVGRNLRFKAQNYVQLNNGFELPTGMSLEVDTN